MPSNVSDSDEFDFEDFHDNDDSFSFTCVSVEDVAIAIGKLKSKAIGIDDLPYGFLKIILPYVSNLLFLLVNRILTVSVYPSACKTARVVPIPMCNVVNCLDDCAIRTGEFAWTNYCREALV